MKNMYALLVGLNNYKERIKPLNGCVPDIERFEKYLRTNHGLGDDHIKTLIDSAATKKSIIDQFRQHLGKAEAGDTALFYFAGHGVLQVANPSLKTSVMNDKIECISCYDTTLTGANLIADKELRWLIHELNKGKPNCHIVCIFDSCNSGDNTRDVSTGLESVTRLIQDEYGEKIMDMRQWNEFVFHNSVTEAMINEAISSGGNLDDVLPQGAHIQIAAAASNETAKETPSNEPERYGYFSHYLLELLEATKGKITYYDLRSLIYQKLNRLPERKRQAPQFYAMGTSIFQPVFGGTSIEQDEVLANVFYNKEQYRWEMDMGGIYGIPDVNSDAPIEIFVNLDKEGSQTEAVAINKVYSDYSSIRILSDKSRLDTEKTYQTSARKFMQKPLKVACLQDRAKTAWQSFCRDNAQQLVATNIEWVDDVSMADYVIYTEGGAYWLALPDKPQLPLAEQVVSISVNGVFELLLKQLAVISRWAFVKEHKNKLYSGSLLNYVELTYEQDATKQTLNDGEKFDMPLKRGFEYYQDADVYWSNDRFTLRVKNTHPTDTIHLAGVWLTELFGVESTVINQNSLSTPLQAGKSTFISVEQAAISFKPYLKEFGWEKFDNTIKVFVSTHSFGLTHYQQMALNPPVKAGSRSMQGTRGDMGLPPTKTNRVAEWTVKTVTFNIAI